MGMSPALRPPGAAVTSPPGVSQSNGLPRPPTMVPPVSTGLRPSTPTSSPMSNGLMSTPPISGPSGTYQNQQQNSIPTSGAYGTYNYAAAPVCAASLCFCSSIYFFAAFICISGIYSWTWKASYS